MNPRHPSPPSTMSQRLRPVNGSRGGNPLPTLQELVNWLGHAPPGTSLDASAMHALLEPLVDTPPPQPQSQVAEQFTWQERLWTAPAATRIGVRELAEALGRPKSWVYRRTGRGGNHAPLPHKKLDSELVFVVEEIRRWLTQHEEVAVPESAIPMSRVIPLVR